MRMLATALRVWRPPLAPLFFRNVALNAYFPVTAAHCQSVGAVMQSEISRQASGRSKGWGLVDYASPQFAANVR